MTQKDKNENRERLEQELRGLKDLLSVAQVVVSSLELDEVLQNILGSAMAIMDMPAGSIALYEESNAQLSLHAHQGFSEAFSARKRWAVKTGGLSERILREGETLVVEDTAQAEFFRSPLAQAEGIRSLLAVPLKIQDKILGVLYLDDFKPRSYPPDQLELLSVLASFAVMSIDNACLHKIAQHLACTDGLTGLYNYRQFQKTLKEEIRRARRQGNPFALVLFDVDNFKSFNDTFGHPEGDRALVTVAEILAKSLRECDILFRYGGEEFAAILPETHLEEAMIAAERARSALERDTLTSLREIGSKGLTVSVGVACYPADGENSETLLKSVDGLLYQAKKEGKNKIYSSAGSGLEKILRLVSRQGTLPPIASA